MSSQTVETPTLYEIYTELKQFRKEFHQVKELLEYYIVNSSPKQKSISDFELEQEKEDTAWYHKFMDRASSSGGNPIIKGTQTPVGDIIEYSLHQDVVGILQSLPHLMCKQVEAALV